MSYSHENFAACRDFVSALRESAHLVPMPVELWDDDLINPGEQFREKIHHAIQTCDIAFLLISTEFFKSAFICHDEIPAVKARVAQRRMVMIPIKVGEFAKKEYEGLLNDLQAWPLKNGKLISISELAQAERRHAFADLHRWAVAARKLWTQRLEVKTLNRVIDATLKETSERLAGLYRRIPEEVVYTLALMFWILWAAKKNHLAAIKLAKFFCSEVNRLDINLDEGHKPTINLLSVGLPKAPTHLEILEVSNVSYLLEPNNARLLLGMRLTEVNYPKAGRFFQELRKEELVFQRCALVGYAWGQCLRKQELLVEAVDRLDLALVHCLEWPEEFCNCTGVCPRGMLLVEINRGLGAAHRKASKPDRAMSHFKTGEELLARDDVPIRIKADFLYSFGYFLFEDAVRAPMNRMTWQLDSEQKVRLQAAKAKFERCIEFEPEHPAALARLEIVKKLFGDFSLSGWIRSRNICLKHREGESVLSAFLSGFAIRLHALTVDTSEPVEVDSKGLYTELAEVFETWPNGVPLGPINCHFFDITVVRWGTDIKSDSWLNRAYDLLAASREWRNPEKGNLKQAQLKGLQKFESTRKIVRHRNSM